MRSRSLIIYFFLIYAVLFLFLSIFLKSCKQVLNYWNSLAYIKCLEPYYSFNEIYIYIYISFKYLIFTYSQSFKYIWVHDLAKFQFYHFCWDNPQKSFLSSKENTMCLSQCSKMTGCVFEPRLEVGGYKVAPNFFKLQIRFDLLKCRIFLSSFFLTDLLRWGREI